MDRTARNPNLLCWHRSLYFIDHGAALYFHHDWKDLANKARAPFQPIRNHLLLPLAGRIETVDTALRAKLGPEILSGILQSVPDAWLLPEPGVLTPAEKRLAYVDYFVRRLHAASLFVEEAVRARAALV